MQYKYYASLNENKHPKIEKINLSTNLNLDLVWLEILGTNIDFLPNQSEIEYKLRGKLLIETLANGEYEHVYKSTIIMDGIHYKVSVRNNTKINEITFDNPESYLKLYPEVDELIDFCNLLKLLKKSFSS
ncbi:conserved hypothetical protein [Flavobacterium sp. 9AF]|nr:conserved hypothetical protein [Flavobacterium sp. 9AF]